MGTGRLNTALRGRGGTGLQGGVLAGLGGSAVPARAPKDEVNGRGALLSFCSAVDQERCLQLRTPRDRARSCLWECHNLGRPEIALARPRTVAVPTGSGVGACRYLAPQRRSRCDATIPIPLLDA